MIKAILARSWLFGMLTAGSAYAADWQTFQRDGQLTP